MTNQVNLMSCCNNFGGVILFIKHIWSKKDYQGAEGNFGHNVFALLHVCVLLVLQVFENAL